MLVWMALLAAGSPGTAQDPVAADRATYTDREMNLSFTHPTAWKITKREKRDQRVIFTVPLEGSKSGELELIRAQFRGEKDAWQSLQLTSNELQKRTVTRQWEQTVLGVPLLFTQVQFTDRGTAYTQVSGLFYSRTVQKLLFHLKAPASGFEAAFFEWQRSLESFRTVSGTELPVEDPSAPPETRPRPGPVVVRKVVDTFKLPPKRKDLTFAGQMSVSGKTAQIDLPPGWLLKDVDGAKGRLVHPKLGLEVAITLNYTLDSPDPIRSIIETSAKRLDQFERVIQREDVERAATPYGLRGSVARLGEGKAGTLVQFDGFFANPDFYLLFEYAGTEIKRWPELRRALYDLQASVDVKLGQAGQ
ncbi:MAG: hypothetical protein SFX74_03485 [Fimbriimonadaceae bacterium]|nr:hypothetical protein [Fimbriimonadaceae bacterium]